MSKKICELSQRSIRRLISNEVEDLNNVATESKNRSENFNFKTISELSKNESVKVGSSTSLNERTDPNFDSNDRQQQIKSVEINLNNVRDDVIKSTEYNILKNDFVNNDFKRMEFPRDNILHDVRSNVQMNTEHDQFVKNLRHWAVQSKSSHASITSLLTVLRKHSCHTSLPRNAKSLLKTPRKAEVVIEMPPGHYIHFGLESGIRDYVREHKSVSNPMKLKIGIDGVPITKVPETNAWPILASVYPDGNIFVIGCYYGCSKPDSVEDYLSKFVDDIINFMQNGISIDDTVYYGEIRFIICDLPGKAYILNTKGHTGFFSCFKCKIKGKRVDGTTCFPDFNCDKRTNDEMHEDLLDEMNSDDEENQDNRISLSPLSRIPNFDLIQQVPIDYMHLICLGIVRKLVALWVFGRKFRTRQIDIKRWNPLCRLRVSLYLNSIRKYIPMEFGRKPAPLKDCRKWKAVHSRLFLGYIGPVALTAAFTEDTEFVRPFLALHVAFRILSSFENPDDVRYAHSLCMYFLETIKQIYGESQISPNMHSLSHICEEVLNLGLRIDEFSAFLFENFMRHLKRLIRKPGKPLQQISNRLSEIEFAESCIAESKKNIGTKVKGKHDKGPLMDMSAESQFSTIIINSITLKTSVPNNCCIIDDDIVVIENINYNIHGKLCIIGRKYMNVISLYSVPCPSERLGISKVKQLSVLKMWSINGIKNKCIRIPIPNAKHEFAIIPYLHVDSQNR